MFIDIHCHLDYYKDKEIEEIVRRMEEKGVKIAVTNGTSVNSNRAVLKIAEKYPEIKTALGIYPIEALKMSDKEIDKEIEFIRKNKDRIVAIGEVGIDLKESEDFLTQEKTFRKFVSVSIELNKPIIIHSRKAEEKCIEILEEMKAKKVVMHCFSGKWKFVERILKNEWFLTAPTSIKRSEQFQNIAKEAKIEQLFCETDSPFLHPDRENNNEPGNVIESYKKIAEVKGIKIEKIEKAIEKNFRELFLSS